MYSILPWVFSEHVTAVILLIAIGGATGLSPSSSRVALIGSNLDSGDDSSEHSHLLRVAVLMSASLGGILHGVAMALRKRFGEGHVQYWLEWRWWIGALVDAAAGLMIWPAMPVISVQLLMPLVTVLHLVTTYAIGLFALQEPPQLKNHLGAICCVAGIIGISMSSSRVAAEIPITAIWKGFVQPVFLATFVSSVVFLCFAGFVLGAWAFWALTGGFLEGMQYLCSRTLADAVYEGPAVMSTTSKYMTIAALCVIKGLCIIAILHTQQLGMASNLSRFAGIYLVACTIFICALGAAMFGDNLEMNPIFMISMFLTLVGIGLLSYEEPCSVGEPSQVKQEASEAEGK
mmetsp:Transcript_129961/g.253171  ORF Transcript_129961/g.253171 Transcript_129961/m.253171 type:complete len:346 (-) Transcript_129961:34-1071(-)